MGSIRNSVYYSVLTNNGSLLVNFATTAIVSRLLIPSEIGIFVVCLAFILFLEAVRGFGMDHLIIQESHITSELLRSVFGFSLLSSITITMLIWIAAPFVAEFYGESTITGFLRIMVLSYLLSPFTVPYVALMQRDMLFGSLMILRFTASIVNMAVALSLIHIGFGVLSLAVGFLVARVAEFVVVLLSRGREIFLVPHFSDWRRIVSFGAGLSFARVLVNLGTNTVEMVIGRSLGLSDAAFFSRGTQFLRIYRTGVEMAIGPVALSAFAEERRRPEGNVRKAYLNSVSLLSAIAWPAFAFLVVYAEPAIRIVYGPGWEGAVTIAQVLAIGGAVNVLSSLTPQLLTSQGRVGELARRELYIQPVRLGLVLGAASISLVAVAWALVATYLVTFAVSLNSMKRAVGLRLTELLEAVRMSFGIGAVTLIATVFIRWMSSGVSESWLAVFIGAAFVAPVWLLMVLITSHPLKDEVLRAASRVVAKMRG